jgi:sterol desaturase/sphingolipid hydroxylase (fatty acid hydroxylase superfamily)
MAKVEKTEQTPPPGFEVFLQPQTYLSDSNGVYLSIAFLIWFTHYTVFPLETHEAPESWYMIAVAIIVRNFLLVFAVYSEWHRITHVACLCPTKFNEKMPPLEQTPRDQFWTLSGSLWASAYELGAVYLWKTGVVEYARSITEFRFVAFFIVASFWSDWHFWFAHRVMHPWRIGGSLDPGKFLYKQVHSLHHKSVNPGPWSGLAMHPVEHVVYFSRILWPVHFMLTVHPVLVLYTNVRAMLGPAPGHHGHKELYGGQFHYLHHAHFECNYGTRGALDAFMGTYRAA